MKKLNFTENGNYTMVPNGILRSGKLSAKALGVYFLIVSLPDNWNFSVKGLCTLCSDGYNAVSSAVRELEEAGFLKRKPKTGENGRFSECEWEIECKPLNENPSTEKPSSDEPSADEPSSENQPQLNTKQQKTKQTNTKQVKDSSYELYAARENAQPVIDAWNGAGLTPVKSVTPGSGRYRMLKARLSRYGENEVLNAIEKAKNSAFLNGQNARGWVITFDWFVRPENFLKVLEGNYDNREKNAEAAKAPPREPCGKAEKTASYDIEAFNRMSLADSLVYVKRKDRQTALNTRSAG